MKARATLGGWGLAALLASAACGSHDRDGAPLGPLGEAFSSSAAAAGVPRDLLVALAATEGGLALPAHRTVEPEAMVAAAGPLQLRHGRFDSLARGAALVGATELALREDTDLALDAAARVLAEVGARMGAEAGDLASWGPALEEMSGYADAPHRRDYARRVFALLARGGTFPGRDGEPLHLAPHDLPPHVLFDANATGETHVSSGGAEYPGADWFPTSCTGKCATGRSGTAIDEVVIHDTEGGWDASVATLQNDPGKSVQYIVGTDGRVGQFVLEADTAWHAGNHVVNERSIGIEHVGYATQPYPEAEYAASARLVLHLTAKYGIAKDRAHIIGHDQVPNGSAIAESSPPCADSPKTCEASNDYGGSSNHRDPGVWEWATYMPRFGGSAKCNDVWALWNCSHDHTQAFRCSAGKVSVEACAGGCVTEPLGQDDTCNPQAPSAADAGPSLVDASRIDGAAGDTAGGSADPAGSGGPRATSDGGASLEASADVAADASCRASRARLGGGGGSLAACSMAAALAIALGARKRRVSSRV